MPSVGFEPTTSEFSRLASIINLKLKKIKINKIIKN